ncbi:GAF domain-containing protein [Leptolyngbya sp. CCNP1308]|uniref:GAF domain-containing protein n=1 Tax=Leptolyngbya sp. CCNP1308 TaxID=3110255 RepID=UPI002B1EE72A|nr:GAF domain-containing protein [Leptolyngbya sp. CCNP1308]MEA5452430.1 GAF domain-containing protein [Leptolyngbya sp. CCNP1308]
MATFRPAALTVAIIHDPLTIGPDSSVMDAIALMSGVRTLCPIDRDHTSEGSLHPEAHSSCVVVVDNDQVVGLLTERDVVRLNAQQRPLDQLSVAEAMTQPVITRRPSDLTDLISTIELLQRHHLRHLPLVDEQDRLAGLVTHESLQQAFSPLEYCTLTKVLEKKVTRLETERVALLENRAAELERQVAERTQIVQVQAERDRLMAGLASQILASLDVQVILDTTVHQVRQILGCDHVSIWRFEPEWAAVVVAESTDADRSFIGERIADTCFLKNQAEAYRQGRIRVVPDIYATEMADCHRDMLTRLQIRAKILMPLLCGDELWGLLNVTEAQPRDWQPAEIDFVRSLSMQLAIALNQASTHEQLQSELHERQQAERQLRQSTERLQEAQRIAHIGNWELDLQHNTLYWSEEVFRLYEIDPQQFGASYEAFLDLVHPDDRTLVDDAYADHLRDRQPFSLVHRLQMADGRIKYVREQCETTCSADGSSLISRGTVQDVTQQQEAEIRRDRAEDSLRQVIEGTATFTGEAFFSALVRHISEALRTRYVSVSQATPEGLQLLAFFADGKLRPPAFLPYDLVPCCHQSLQTGSCCHPADIHALYPDNALFTDLQVDSYLGVRLQNAAGEPIGNLCIFHDAPLADPHWAQTLLSIFAARAGAELERLLTAQALEQLNADLEERVGKRTEELQESQQFLQTVLDTVPLSVFWKDRASTYLGANRLFLQDAGLSFSSELVGKTDFEMPWGATEAEAYRTDDRIVMENGEAKLAIIEPQHQQDGTTIWLETNKLPLRNLAGEVVGVLGTYQDITERKNAEIALQRQLAAIEAAVNGIAILENERYLYLNSSHVKMFGYEQAEELIGQSWRTLYSPEELKRLEREIFPVLLAQKSWQGEVTATRKDGTTFPEQLSLTLSADNLLICVCQDNSERAQLDAERKQAEAALRESERRYAMLAQAVPVAIFRFDLEGHCTYVNERWCEMTGKPIAFALGDRWLETIHPDDRERSQIATQQWLQAGAVIPFQHEARILRDDGSIVWYYCQMLLETATNGERLGYVGTLTDISDRKQSEDALRESEEKFRQLAEVVDAVFWILHLNRTDRVYVSPAYERIWGRPCTELYVTPDAWVEMIHVDDREQVLAAIPKQIQGTFDEEYRIIRPDGTQRWIHDRAFPIRNAQGQIYRLAGIAEDVTERKRSEEIIRQQADRETVLREITQRIRESLDLQTIFNTACDEIRTCLQADRVGIFKFYPDSGYDDGEFVAESVVHGFPSAVAIRIHDHCFGENYTNLYAQGRYHAVDDIYHNGLTPCHTDILAQFQVRANLVMPLLCNNELWGLLCIHQCDAPRHWHQSEIDLGHQLANQLAIAIQQAILYEQLQTELQERQRAEATITQQLRQQTALELILQQIRQSLDLPEILAIATQQVQELLHSDRVIVFQVCHDGHSHIVEEAVAPDLPRLKALHWEDETWSQDILEHYWQGQPRIVPDVMDDVWTNCLVDYSHAGQIQSKIVAPILQELRDTEAHRWAPPEGSNKLWGVLVVHACRTNRVWHQDEAQLLQQIANQLAIAIQQASLFEQLQQELQERQQAQAQLTLTNGELMRATRLKDEFLANMSHELRTPLNAILGMTEMLQEEDVFGPVNAPQLKALKTVERSGSHLLELINDVLDVAKIEAGQLELDCHPTAIAPLCQSSLAFIKQPALKQGLRLAVNLPPNLPAIALDERRMRQVLINLLSNAVKFTPEGGQVTLDVSLLPPSQICPEMSYLRFAVIDTGIGITPKNMQRLFQPFVQVDSALNRQYQGTGLGLALVKRIVELHGGQVSLTSDVGVGSCFTVDLPYGAVIPLPPTPPPPLAVASETASPTAAIAPATAPLILLAEDNEANISTLVSYLQAKGYRVEIAYNGQEAIDQAQQRIPDLILMDIQMPKMDGLEAIGHLRRVPKLANVPVIALTALAMPGDRDRCIAAGATDYLAKPVSLKQLIERIHMLLTA